MNVITIFDYIKTFQTPLALRSLSIAFAIFLFTFMPTKSWAQLEVALDLATFRYDASNNYTEIYYSIPIAGLEFVKTESDSLQVEAIVNLTLAKGDSLWDGKTWRMQKTFLDSTQIRQGERMVDALHYFMEPGNYRVSISVADKNNQENSHTTQQDFTILIYPGQELGLSDIQIANSIRRAKKTPKNVFYKNSLEVIPKPSKIYSHSAPVIYFYIEAYNLAKTIKGESYKTRCHITNPFGQPVTNVKPREQIKNLVDSSIEVGTMNVASLPSGTYHLQFELLDKKDNLLQSASKQFFVYNPEVKSPGTYDREKAIQSSEFTAMTEKQLNSEIEMAQCVASREEKELFKNLKGAEPKRNYLFEFWHRRDSSPNTPLNEYRSDFKTRVRFADEHFRSYTRKGWKTDRGRVHIVYGPPNEIERFPNNPLSYNYQIWHYDQIEGGVIFVFADLQEFGEYMQLHSTKRGEPMNKDWEKQIKK